MASEVALGQAREFIERANSATDDPRRTRIDLLQVSNYVARRSREDSDLRDLISYVGDFLSRQMISAEDLKVAAQKGWPALEAVDGPESYYHASVRLAAHSALRTSRLIDSFEARIADVAGLSASVRQSLEAVDPDWASALTLVAAEMAAEPGEFRSRLIAAAKDVQQLVTGDEMPTLADFREGRAGSEWPPLTLGVVPVLGGRFREDPKDWEEPIAYGGFGAAACIAGFALGMGDTLKTVLCVVGIIAIILFFIFLAP